MNKNKFLTLVLVLTILLTSSDISYASIKNNLNFKNITVEDGLSQSTVETIFQDSKGYIWIGTNDGLNRYNGYEVKHYKHDRTNKNSISNNYIVDIIEDKEGFLWISTIHGLNKLNPQTDEVEIFLSNKNGAYLSDSNIRQLICTNDNKIIATTVNGLNLYNKSDNRFTRVLGNKNDLPSQLIYSIEEDNKGNLWIGTDKGLVKTDKNFNILNRYKDTIGETEIYNLYYDHNGYMWVCTITEGLYRIDLKNENIINYRFNNNKYSLPSNTIRDLIHDANGNLWIATSNGLCFYNYETELFITYQREAYERDTLVSNDIFCLFKDSSDLIWIGTYNGVSTFKPEKSFIHLKSEIGDFSINSNVIHGIYEDDDNTLWVGSDQCGVKIINDNTFKYLNTQNSNLISNNIEDITGHENKVYIGTNDGLSVLVKNDNKGNNYTITNYTTDNGLPTNKIRSLYIDRKGYLWIGFIDGIAILTKEGTIIDISHILKNNNIQDNFIRAIYEDSQGNYYIGCFLYGGLLKINPNKDEYKVYKSNISDPTSISSNSIRYITEDLNGKILIGTSYGLNILDPKSDTFKSYTEKEGLANNTVYGVLVDNNNSIWMSTNSGISNLNLEDNSFRSFTVTDGLQSNEFNSRACFKNEKGFMYFGGMNGFNILNVNDLEISSFKPKVIFDRFEVNGLFENDISNKKLLSSDNNIKVTFFTDDYKYIDSAKYYYKLEGVNSEWHTADTNSILFANLAPGEYTLKVKAITNHGVMGEENKVSFIINPPFWKSKYSLFMYLAIIIVVIYIQKNKIRNLDILVNKKTVDLRKEMEKNEQLFERVLKLEQNKNNYFVNLSHELRTPLNVLTSLKQLLYGLAQKDSSVSSDKVIYYMDIMGKNCTRLLKLINNLIDYTKIENDNYNLNKKDENIVYLVEEVVFDLKDYIEDKGINLIFDTDVEEKIIKCDKLEIERCIVNLVGNAAKFTPEGGLIQVLVNDLDNIVKISVKDNGIGISEENQEIIFNKFNQVVDETSEVKGGSGLGLTITKQLITLHGGNIYVKSELDKGSEFVILLPTN